MTLKLLLVPDQDGYTATEGESIVSSKTGGGQPRMRLDLLNPDSKVEVQFTLTPTEYQYMRAFFKVINQGADQFLMDLVIETPALREYVCRMVPGTWKLTSLKGTAFKVKFTVSVASNDAGVDYAALVSGFTPETYVPPADPVDWGIE